jgi:hypothetical protein
MEPITTAKIGRDINSRRVLTAIGKGVSVVTSASLFRLVLARGELRSMGIGMEGP